MNKVCAPVVEPIGSPVSAGVTWADFKRAVEKCGVRDADVIDSIEYRMTALASGRIVTAVGDDGIEIRDI